MNRELKRQLLIQDGRHAMRLYAQGKNCAQACEALGRSRQTLWRACKAFGEAHPDEANAIMHTPRAALDAPRMVPVASGDHRPGELVRATDADPLLDGWEPETVEPVTDSDIDELLA